MTPLSRRSVAAFPTRASRSMSAFSDMATTETSNSFEIPSRMENVRTERLSSPDSNESLIEGIIFQVLEVVKAQETPAGHFHILRHQGCTVSTKVRALPSMR